MKHCRIGGQENRQDDEDDLKDTARGKRTYGGADCEDRASHGRKERVLQFAPGTGLLRCRSVLRRANLRVQPRRAMAAPADVGTELQKQATELGTAGVRANLGT